MQLGMHEGRICWIDDSGNPSGENVSDLDKLPFLGFPIPSGPEGGKCRKLTIELGDPLADGRLVVDAGGKDWFGTYLLDKKKGKAERLTGYAFRLLKDGDLTLKKAPTYIESRLREIDPEKLTDREGLRADIGTEYGAYHFPEINRFCSDLPDGWELLPKGDSALTSAVKRRGAYWALLVKHRRYAEAVGLAAPTAHIVEEEERLGGEEAKKRRLRGKHAGIIKREEQLSDQFEAALRKCFPRMPDPDVREVVERARSVGVGRAQWLYIQKKEHKDAALAEAATLAVAAHARHSYTDYDELMNEAGSDPFAGEEGEPSFHAPIQVSNEIRRLIRSEVQDAVSAKLVEWRGEATEGER